MKRAKRIVTKNDYEKILKEWDNNNHRTDAALFAMETGMRLSEIARIRTWDVFSTRDGKVKNSFIPSYAKCSSKEKILLTDLAKKIIIKRNTRSKKGYLWPLKPISIYRQWRRLQEKIFGEKKYCFHDLRRTAITRIYHRKGLLEASKFARHKSIETTKIYII